MTSKPRCHSISIAIALGCDVVLCPLCPIGEPFPSPLRHRHSAEAANSISSGSPGASRAPASRDHVSLPAEEASPQCAELPFLTKRPHPNPSPAQRSPPELAVTMGRQTERGEHAVIASPAPTLLKLFLHVNWKVHALP